MAGRFEHFETQMVDQEDQARLIEARGVLRQESRTEELREFQQARSAAASSVPPVAPAMVPPAKISPKTKPKLPSFLQPAAVERAKRPHSEVSQSSAPQESAPKEEAAEAAPAKASVVSPAKAATPSVVSSLVAYGDSDDEEEEPAEG